MRLRNFEWDDTNIEHIARHQVTFQEVEEACYNVPYIIKSHQSRHLIYGQTDSGRYLLMVIYYRGRGLVRVITARDMTEAERKLYHHKRG